MGGRHPERINAKKFDAYRRLGSVRAHTVNGRRCIRHVSNNKLWPPNVSVKPLKAKTEIKNGLDRA